MATAAAHVTKIEPPRGFFDLDLGELWRYRQLLYFLTWRDVKARYKQTVLRGAWAVLQPFLMMVVFSVIFGRIARVSSGGIPYPIFSYAGLVPWTLFAQSVNNASLSLVNSYQLVTKIYIPRLAIPSAAVASTVMDFAIALSLTAFLMVYYGVYPSWQVVFILPLTLLALVASLGVGLWLSALNATYRDVRYATPFLVQLWLFVTPVVYQSRLLGRYEWLLGLNPMAGVVEGFRWALLGTGHLEPVLMALSVLVAFGVFFTGIFFFKWSEPRIVDVI